MIAGEWSKAGMIFAVDATKQNGKWSLNAEQKLGGNDYPKTATDKEMHEFEIAVQKSGL